MTLAAITGKISLLIQRCLNAADILRPIETRHFLVRVAVSLYGGQKVSQEQILGIVRHVLTFAGGVAVAKGLIDAETLAQASGAIITLIGVIWSFRSKSK